MSIINLIENDENELIFPPGLTYEEDCITPEAEEKIIKYLDKQEWNTTLSRRTQHYGYEYDYKNTVSHSVSLSNTAVLKEAPPVNGPLLSIAKHFIKNGTLKVNKSNHIQCIVNEYKSNQGIAPHTDSKIFGDTIVCMSLGDPVTMIFQKGEKSIPLRLAPRSVFTIEGEARYKWLHSIPKQVRKVGFRRISLTYRTVPINLSNSSN